MLNRSVLIAVLLFAAPAASADHAALPEGVTPVMATWLWGYHTVPASVTVDGSPYWYAYPHTDAAPINDPRWTEVAAGHVRPDTRVPAVLFLHGCSGMIRGGVGYRVMMVAAGYAVFEPDAFARPGHTCGTSSTATRLEEIGYALARIRELSWVDQDRIVLMGFSEGGRTVGLWGEPGFRAHIIVGAPAHSRAPEGVPVLAVAGRYDDFASPPGYATEARTPGSTSVLIDGAGHDILGHPEFKRVVREFLIDCCPP